jgi:hypothetical protein
MRCLSSLPRPIDAEGICKRLAGKVAEWAAGADRFDDTTILALSVAARASVMRGEALETTFTAGSVPASDYPLQGQPCHSEMAPGGKLHERLDGRFAEFSRPFERYLVFAEKLRGKQSLRISGRVRAVQLSRLGQVLREMYLHELIIRNLSHRMCRNKPSPGSLIPTQALNRFVLHLSEQKLTRRALSELNGLRERLNRHQGAQL